MRIIGVLLLLLTGCNTTFRPYVKPFMVPKQESMFVEEDNWLRRIGIKIGIDLTW